MKVCEKCNIEYSDDKKFCRNCGNILISNNPLKVENQVKNETLTTSKKESRKSRKQKKKKVITGLVAFLVLVIAVSISIFHESLFSSFKKEEVKELGSNPMEPYVQKNVCPFEGCQYGNWIAKRNVTIYKEQSINSKKVGQVQSEEQVNAIKGDMVFTQIEKVLVTESFNKFLKGDTVFILSYQGEGYYSVWYKDNIISTFIFWENPRSSGQEIKGEILCPSISNWWVYVKTQSGKEGWVDNTKHLFKGADIFD